MPAYAAARLAGVGLVVRVAFTTNGTVLAPWQLGKNTKRHERTSRSGIPSTPPVPLKTYHSKSSVEAPDAQWRRVTATGRSTFRTGLVLYDCAWAFVAPFVVGGPASTMDPCGPRWARTYRNPHLPVGR